MQIGNISPYDWKTTPKDYKSIINGQRYVLTMNPDTGATVLRPVNILRKEIFVVNTPAKFKKKISQYNQKYGGLI